MGQQAHNPARRGQVVSGPGSTGVWTAPSYGTQHLLGLREGFSVTVIDRGLYSECRASAPNGGTVKSSHPTAESARSHGVSTMVLLKAYAIEGVPA